MNKLMLTGAVLALLLGCSAKPEPADAVKAAGTIPLPDVTGRIDHFALDAKGNRLFVAALGNNTVEVIDLKTSKPVARITGVKKPQGLAYLPDLDRLVVASGDDGKVRFYDAALNPIGQIDALDDADNVRYDAATKTVYVGYGDGALAVIEAQQMKKVADIRLEGHPESFQLETHGKRLFVNVPSAKHVAVIDREKREVIGNWPIDQAASNFPMALDEEHHRLFIGCRKPAKLLVLDTDNGKTVAAVDCVGDTDDLFYSAEMRRIFIVGGEGVVTAVQPINPDRYAPAGQIATATGARTGFFVPTSRTLYVAAPKRDGQACQLHLLQAEPRDAGGRGK